MDTRNLRGAFVAPFRLTAEAGADQLAGERAIVTLDASASRGPQGAALAYRWTQTGGPAVFLQGAAGARPSFVAPAGLSNTLLRFEVAVSDGRSSAVDSVEVLVNASYDAPTLDAGPDASVPEGARVTLAGSAARPDGRLPTWTWTQVSGPAVTLAGANGPAPKFTSPQGLANTDLVFQASLCDGRTTVIDTVTITVHADEDAPSCDAGPMRVVRESDVIRLFGTASDPRNRPLTCTWTQTAGPAVPLANAHTLHPSFVAPVCPLDTTLAFELRVSDGGSTAVDTVRVLVNSSDEAPVVEAGPTLFVEAGGRVTLGAAAVDPHGDELSYAWTQTGGPIVALSDPNSLYPVFVAPEGLANTTISFQLAVSDGTHVTLATQDVVVHADENAPTAEAGPAQAVEGNERVTLSGSGVDPKGKGLSYDWTQTAGPGVELRDADTAAATFTAPEGLVNTTLTFQLALSDGTSTSYDTVSILLHADADAPTAEAGPAKAVYENELVTLSGSAFDPRGGALTYTWTQTGGPIVVLSDEHAAAPTFTAPKGLADTSLTFELTVSDGANTSCDTVTVDVFHEDQPAAVDAGPTPAAAEARPALAAAEAEPAQAEAEAGHALVAKEASPALAADESAAVALPRSALELQREPHANIGAQRGGPSLVNRDDEAVKPKSIAPTGLPDISPILQRAVPKRARTSDDEVAAGMERDDHLADPTSPAPERLADTSRTLQRPVADENGAGNDNRASDVTPAADVDRDDDVTPAEAEPAQPVYENHYVSLPGADIEEAVEPLACTWMPTSGPVIVVRGDDAVDPALGAPADLAETSRNIQRAVPHVTSTGDHTPTADVNRDDDVPTVKARKVQSVDQDGVASPEGSHVEEESRPVAQTWKQDDSSSTDPSDAEATHRTSTAPEDLADTSREPRRAVPRGGRTIDDTPTDDGNRDDDVPNLKARKVQSVDEDRVDSLEGSHVEEGTRPRARTWEQVGSPGTDSSDADAAEPTFTEHEGLADTSQDLRPSIPDGTSASYDTASVDVNRDEGVPTIEVGRAQSLSGHQVASDAGSSVEEQGEPVAQGWDEPDSPSVASSDANAADPTLAEPEGLADTSRDLRPSIHDDTGTSGDTASVDASRDENVPTVEADRAQSPSEDEVASDADSSVEEQREPDAQVWAQSDNASATSSYADATEPTFTEPNSLADTWRDLRPSIHDDTRTSYGTGSIDVNRDVDRDEDVPTVEVDRAQSLNEHQIASDAGSSVEGQYEPDAPVWAQSDSPSATSSYADAAEPTFTEPNCLADTSRDLRPSIHDDTGTSYDTASVDVNRDENVPTVEADPAQSLNEHQVASDADSSVEEQGESGAPAWTQSDSPSATSSYADAAEPTFTEPDGVPNTPLTFQPTTSDGMSANYDSVPVDGDRDSIPAEGNRDDGLPADEARPAQSIEEYEAVPLAESGVGPQGQALARTSTHADDPTVELSDPSSIAPTFAEPEGPTSTLLSSQPAVSDGTRASYDSVPADGSRDSIPAEGNLDDDVPADETSPAMPVEENEAVTLAGAGVDAEGQVLAHAPATTDDPTVEHGDDRIAASTITAPEDLANTPPTAHVGVSDGTSSGFDTTSLDERDDDDATTAAAAPTQLVDGSELVTIARSGIEPEDQALTHTTTETDDPKAEVCDASAAAPVLTAPECIADTPLASLMGVSKTTSTGFDGVPIHVKTGDDTPTAEVAPQGAVEEAEFVTLAGSNVDPEGHALTHAPTHTEDPTSEVFDASAAALAFAAPAILANTPLTSEVDIPDAASTSLDAVAVDSKGDVAPTADAGAGQLVAPGAIVTLSGAAGDPTGRPLSYTWQQLSGPQVPIADPHAHELSLQAHDVTRAEELVFELAVSDGMETSVYTVHVQVQPAAIEDASATRLPAPLLPPAEGAGESEAVNLWLPHPLPSTLLQLDSAEFPVEPPELAGTEPAPALPSQKALQRLQENDESVELAFQLMSGVEPQGDGQLRELSDPDAASGREGGAQTSEGSSSGPLAGLHGLLGEAPGALGGSPLDTPVQPPPDENEDERKS